MNKTKSNVKTIAENFSNERRRFVRHLINFPLKYKIVGAPGAESRSKTLNISRGGLLFTAKEPAKELSKVVMKIPFRNRVYTVKGRVARCKSDLNKKLYEIGVSFYSLSDAFKTRLIEQLYLIGEYRHLRSRQLGREVSAEEAAVEWIRKYSRNFSKLY